MMLVQRWIRLLCIASVLCTPAAAMAADGAVLSQPEAVVLKHGQNESVSIPGTGYSEFSLTKDTASFIVAQGPAFAKRFHVRGAQISAVALEPAAGGCRVTLTLRSAPAFSVINAVNETEWRPGVAQVIAGFGFTAPSAGSRTYPKMGGYESGSEQPQQDNAGGYELPKLPEVHYSDALVSLKVTNTDFREVLWLMSEVGNVSIMLDPYWQDEPTGSRRPPGGGASGATPGGGGGDGFRGAQGFNPIVPREGTGRLTLDFKDVPFDLALDLILQSVGLVKVDIWPEA
jgi:hypothetical protein